MTRPIGVKGVLSPAVGCWIGWLGADGVFWVWSSQLLCNHWSLRERYTDTGHQVVSLRVLRHITSTFELHVYSGQIRTYDICCGIHHAFKMLQEDLPWEIIFDLGVLRINAGDQPIEWNKYLGAVFRKCSMLIFVKIRYETTISSVTCRHLKFHY